MTNNPSNKEKVYALITSNECLTVSQISKIVNLPSVEIEKIIEEIVSEGKILGWRPIINPSYADGDGVRALIEVRMTPEREGGFDRVAERVSGFDEVESCYLVSGNFDLILVVKGKTLQQIARFVSERLASIGGVLATSTHFMLRAYKEQGFVLDKEEVNKDKPAISA